MRERDVAETRGHSPPARPRDELLVVGSAAGGLGGAVAAVLAALCCIGPASVAVLGAGWAVVAGRLTPYRPAILLVSFILLALGFWSAYGQRTVVDGRACPVRVGRVARTVLWIAAATWLAAAILPAR